jgi:hypothetical protein
MTTTNAYYLTETSDPEEPCRHDVTVTTEHPLSSYGQPVVVSPDGAAIPAQSYPRPLYLHYLDARDERSKELVARANRLSGHGDGTSPSETRAAFAGFFTG